MSGEQLSWAGDVSLDRYARLVSRALSVPLAVVTVVEGDRHVFPGAVGLPEPYQTAREAALDISLSRHVVEASEPLVIADARNDERGHGTPAIHDPHVGAYAGWPLVDPDGQVLGALVAVDAVPREWTTDELADLEDLAAACSVELSQRLLAAQLASVVDELRRSNTELTAFAAQVSHDLRSPLGALSSALQLLEDAHRADVIDVQVLDDLVVRARSSTTRMSDLVTSVLAFAIVGGRLAVESVDVAAVVASVLEDLDLGADSLVEVGEIPPVLADAVQLRIVVQNLIANAVKYAAGAAVLVSARDDDRGWVLSVADRGHGIELADRDRVLQPFVRLDSSLPGSGLGLATCRRIAEAHGGRLEIGETPGGGTTVTLSLPRPAQGRD